jgi:hypothetical protein
MKTPRHGWGWVCERAVGAALIVWLSSLALPAQATTYYVNEGVGNNSYDGLSDVVANGDGPKLNVSAAISTATDGSTIQVDTGDYAETVWDCGANSLTLNPAESVSVCGADLCGVDTVGDGIPDWWRLEYFRYPHDDQRRLVRLVQSVWQPYFQPASIPSGHRSDGLQQPASEHSSWRRVFHQ